MKPLALLIGVSLFLCSNPGQAQESPSAKWQKAIDKFLAQDAEQKPAEGGILFIGSSSVRMWKLDDSFPDANALNRGFGGSEIADSIHFADKIVLPYKPKKIFLYAGDNDVAKGKDAKRVFADFVTFAKIVEEKLPGTELIFIAIKPSTKRWDMWPTMRRANDMILGYTAARKHLHYADIAAPMMGEDGKPKGSFFLEDGLHLNAEGYAAWAKVIGQFL